jgi:hypothetical protein
MQYAFNSEVLSIIPVSIKCSESKIVMGILLINGGTKDTFIKKISWIFKDYGGNPTFSTKNEAIILKAGEMLFQNIEISKSIIDSVLYYNKLKLLDKGWDYNSFSFKELPLGFIIEAIDNEGNIYNKYYYHFGFSVNNKHDFAGISRVVSKKLIVFEKYYNKFTRMFKSSFEKLNSEIDYRDSD